MMFFNTLAQRILTSYSILDILFKQAEVAELADAHDSKSCSFGNVGSIPTFGTLSDRGFYQIKKLPLLICFIALLPERQESQF